ncbi:MAG: DUF433 domain-containing protein [Myxococcota bacterium]
MTVAADASLHSVVEVSPDVMSGTPVFRGTRVPVKNLLDYLAAGDSLGEFLEQFPTVTREQAVALVEVAEELVLARADEDPH